MASVNWLDQQFPWIRRSGFAPGALEDLVSRHGDDPVVSIRCGDGFVEVGMLAFLARVLQAAWPPADRAEKAERLAEPPAPGDLRAALERHRAAFDFAHEETPFLQVRPKPRRLEEFFKKGASPKRAEPDEDEEDEEGAGAMPIGALLPQTPTKSAQDKGTAFFGSAGDVRAVSCALMPGLLTSHMELFPSGGGGYHAVPHGADSVKFMVVGDTLWRTVYGNVLAREEAELAGADWDADGSAPCDARTWPWLDERLSQLSLERMSDKKREKLRQQGANDLPQSINLVRLQDRHPAAPAMPRRYLLDAAGEGTCDLSGMEGPVIRGLSRWTQGNQYAAEGWWHPMVATRVALARSEKGGWEEKSRSFVKASGPLRFDDWLQVACTSEPAEPPSSPEVKSFSRIEPPPVLRSLVNCAFDLRELMPANSERGISALMLGPFRLRAVCQFAFGKTPGGWSDREIALYAAAGQEMAIIAERIVEGVDQIGVYLAHRARQAALHNQHGTNIGRLPAEVKDALLQAMEPPVIEAVSAVMGGKDHASVKAEILHWAADRARRLFDEAFPIVAADKAAAVVATERARLERDIRAKLRKKG